MTLLGNVAPGEMGDIYDRSHLLVCTSESEGFPNTFLEAWTRGIPVISTGPDPEGWLAADGAVVSSGEALKELVRHLADHPSHRAELGARGHSRVSRRCNVNSTVRAYDRLLRVVLNESRRPKRAKRPALTRKVYRVPA